MRAGDLSFCLCFFLSSFSVAAFFFSKVQVKFVELPHNFFCAAARSWPESFVCIVLRCHAHMKIIIRQPLQLPTHTVTTINTMYSASSSHINNAKICFHYQTSRTRLYMPCIKTSYCCYCFLFVH